MLFIQWSFYIHNNEIIHLKINYYIIKIYNPVISSCPKGFVLAESSANIVIKKWNNYIHSSTKYIPNQIFCSHSDNFFKAVLTNIKNSFKYSCKDFCNFSERRWEMFTKC